VVLSGDRKDHVLGTERCLITDEPSATLDDVESWYQNYGFQTTRLNDSDYECYDLGGRLAAAVALPVMLHCSRKSSIPTVAR